MKLPFEKGREDGITYRLGLSLFELGSVVSISGPSVRLNPEKLLEYSELVMATPGHISRDMGCQASLKIRRGAGYWYE